MREELRAGIAIYNEGYYHAAHDAWEDRWLDLESETPDERLLHGLIQFTAAVYHARNRNWEGTVGLAESGSEYLEPLPSTYRGVFLEPIREYLGGLANDPDLIDRRVPPRLTHEGIHLAYDDLDVTEIGIAAGVLGEELGYEREPIELARSYANIDLDAGRDDSRFIAMLFAFARAGAERDVVYQRLVGHVERRRSREDDVSGLF